MNTHRLDSLIARRAALSDVAATAETDASYFTRKDLTVEQNQMMRDELVLLHGGFMAEMGRLTREIERMQQPKPPPVPRRIGSTQMDACECGKLKCATALKNRNRKAAGEAHLKRSGPSIIRGKFLLSEATAKKL